MIKSAQNSVIIVKGHKQNDNFKKFIQDSNKNNIQEQLNNRNINVFKEETKNNLFDIYLYGNNGMLYYQNNKFDNFDLIFKIFDEIIQKTNQVQKTQKGGSHFFYKYLKYKKKYLSIKQI